MGGWMMATASILALLVLGLAVVTVVALMHFNRGSRGGVSRPSARELLEQRYARGEIDDDEYFRRLSVLDSAGPITRAGQ
jgi:putative membrane protein